MQNSLSFNYYKTFEGLLKNNFPHIIIEGKSSTHRVRFLGILANRTISDFENFSPLNYSKFALECV